MIIGLWRCSTCHSLSFTFLSSFSASRVISESSLLLFKFKLTNPIRPKIKPIVTPVEKPLEWITSFNKNIDRNTERVFLIYLIFQSWSLWVAEALCQFTFRLRLKHGKVSSGNKKIGKGDIKGPDWKEWFWFLLNFGSN